MDASTSSSNRLRAFGEAFMASFDDAESSSDAEMVSPSLPRCPMDKINSIKCIDYKSNIEVTSPDQRKCSEMDGIFNSLTSKDKKLPPLNSPHSSNSLSEKGPVVVKFVDPKNQKENLTEMSRPISKKELDMFMVKI